MARSLSMRSLRALVAAQYIRPKSAPTEMPKSPAYSKASRVLVVRNSSSHLGSIAQPVTGAPNGLDNGLLGLAGAKLSAEAADMRLDDSRPRVEMKIPDVFEQHRPSDDSARMPHQILEEAELARLEVDLPLAASAASTDKVEFELTDPDHCSQLRQGGTARQGVYPRGELYKCKGLDEI